jgi:hypothetical protein
VRSRLKYSVLRAGAKTSLVHRDRHCSALRMISPTPPATAKSAKRAKARVLIRSRISNQTRTCQMVLRCCSLKARAWNHPNCLVLRFIVELIRLQDSCRNRITLRQRAQNQPLPRRAFRLHQGTVTPRIRVRERAGRPATRRAGRCASR